MIYSSIVVSSSFSHSLSEYLNHHASATLMKTSFECEMLTKTSEVIMSNTYGNNNSKNNNNKIDNKCVVSLLWWKVSRWMFSCSLG